MKTRKEKSLDTVIGLDLDRLVNECNPFHVWAKISCLMDFLRNGLQSVSRHININFFLYSMVNYSGNFAKPHTGNGCGHEYSQHKSAA